MISFLSRFLQLVSPPSCCVCGLRLGVEEQDICSACLSALPYTRFWEQPMDNPLTQRFFLQMPVERGASLFFYDQASDNKQAIFHSKYLRHPNSAVNLGRMAARLFQQNGFFDGIDFLIPMPLTRQREWSRGFNQSQMIAQGVSEITRIRMATDVVKRVHFAGSQTLKHHLERHDNVKGAFRLMDGGRINGRHVLLIDDVVTTGATMLECGKELAKVGDVKISVMSLAVVNLNKGANNT